MSKITYKPMAVNRPIIIHRGVDGEVVSNEVAAFIGEWIVFKMQLNDTVAAELRIPIDEAFETGLVAPAHKVVLQPEDYEDE